MSLKLSAFPHPRKSARVRVFGSVPRALDHLRDHLLTAPEAEAWGLMVPDYRDVLDPEDWRGRSRLVREMMDQDGQPAGDLYRIYAQAIAQACHGGRNLGWHVETDGVEAYFYTTAVLVLLRFDSGGDSVVLTSFIPGQGSADKVRKSRDEDDSGGSIVRESTRRMRRGRRELREDRERSMREIEWSESERRYFRVFRPAVQFIRRSHFDEFAFDPGRGRARTRRHEYALLKKRLPSSSRLSYEYWRELTDNPFRVQEQDLEQF